ncbi:MAG: hypothetical protein ACRD4A_05850 [Candidatus Acidiferrales bacterium]
MPKLNGTDNAESQNVHRIPETIDRRISGEALDKNPGAAVVGSAIRLLCAAGTGWSSFNPSS